MLHRLKTCPSCSNSKGGKDIIARHLSAAAFGLALAVPAGAFQLDPRFSDNDGDLVADITTDESEWIDPAVLVFAYTPVEDPAVYEDVWAEFLDHLSEATGKPIQFFPVQSNAAQLEAMRAGRRHVAAVNTGGNTIAVACAGFRPFAMMAAEDGSFGYEKEIITYRGSGMEALEDLDGRQLAFTSETSNSGFKAPLSNVSAHGTILVILGTAVVSEWVSAKVRHAII